MYFIHILAYIFNYSICIAIFLKLIQKAFGNKKYIFILFFIFQIFVNSVYFYNRIMNEAELLLIEKMIEKLEEFDRYK